MDVWYWIGGIVVLIIFINAWSNHRRRKMLTAKYHDPDIVKMIMRHIIWQGMTIEQLRDSRGRPAAVDERVYKTKTTLTYKYNKDGRKRFATRVTTENGIVVGWSQR